MATVDEKTTDALDNIFNAWLASHGMLSQDGILYLADKQGRVLRDNQDAPQIIDSDQLKFLLVDPERGLQAYAAKHGLQLKPNLVDFPEG